MQSEGKGGGEVGTKGLGGSAFEVEPMLRHYTRAVENYTKCRVVEGWSYKLGGGSNGAQQGGRYSLACTAIFEFPWRCRGAEDTSMVNKCTDQNLADSGR